MKSISTDTVGAVVQGRVHGNGIGWLASRRYRSAVAALALCVLMSAASVACGGGPTAPSDPMAGSWSGIVDDNLLGRGTLQLTLSNDARLSGQWSLLIATSSAAGSISPVPATASGADRQFTMTCGAPPVGGTLLLTASLDGAALQGAYLSLGCANLTRGSIRLARR